MLALIAASDELMKENAELKKQNIELKMELKIKNES